MSGFQDINILPYIQKYKLTNFIETGCHTGSGINHALMYGLNVYSCDIDKKFADFCRQTFPQAYIAHQHSVDFLKDIIDFVPGNCLFWCDAHFPELAGGISNTEEERFPLFKELEIISRKGNIAKDVIMIDDIRVIISEDNPIKQDFDEQYKIHGTTIKNLTDLFPNHESEVVNFQEGILIFTPKE